MNKEMVVEKINKFKKILKEIIKRIKLGLYVLPEVALTLASIGCAPETAHATPTDPPAASQSADPTNAPNTINTPSPTPTSTPKPTPIPELTYEQKKALLGIDENLKPHKIAAIIAVELSFGNIEKGRIWCVSYENEKSSSKDDFHSAVNDAYLFTLDFKSLYPSSSEMTNSLDGASENLKNLKLINFANLGDMAEQYKVWGISYNDCKEIDEIRERVLKDPEGVGNSSLSGEQMVDLIIKSTPQERIVPFWMYTPGAKIPDILKGIYSEEEYPPAPALPETTVQQSNIVKDNVKSGYREMNYFDSTKNAKKYVVNTINRSYNQTKSYQARRV